jgi:hypothetical protein
MTTSKGLSIALRANNHDSVQATLKLDRKLGLYFYCALALELIYRESLTTALLFSKSMPFMDE